MSFEKIIVAIKPNKELTIEAIDNSRRIANKFTSEILLDESKNIPHISLYLTEIPTRNIITAKEILSKFFRNVQVDLNFSCFHYKNGYFDAEFELTTELSRLHMEILDKINPLREDHIRQKWVESFHEYNQIEQNNIKKYGSVYVAESFRPHLTLAYIPSQVYKADVEMVLCWKSKIASSNSIELYRAGDRGVCIRKL